MSQKPPARIDFSSLRAAPDADAHPTPIETAKAVFGKHPEDVIAPMEEAADVLKGLRTLLVCIGEIAEKSIDRHKENPVSGYFTIRDLAELGQRVAEQMNDYVGSQYAGFAEAIKATEAGEVQS